MSSIAGYFSGRGMPYDAASVGPRAVGCLTMAARGRHGSTHFEGAESCFGLRPFAQQSKCRPFAL